MRKSMRGKREHLLGHAFDVMLVLEGAIERALDGDADPSDPPSASYPHTTAFVVVGYWGPVKTGSPPSIYRTATL